MSLIRGEDYGAIYKKLKKANFCVLNFGGICKGAGGIYNELQGNEKYSFLQQPTFYNVINLKDVAVSCKLIGEPGTCGMFLSP